MQNYPLTLLYDESCPICKLEVENLKARNRQNHLQFIDVSVPDFDTSPYGVSQEEMMAIIHAVKPDGSLVKGVEVFRLAYTAVGLGWITAATAWPIFRPISDWAYRHIARNRYRLSGRFSGILFRLAAKRAEQRSRACHDGLCKAPDHTNSK